MKFSFHEIAEKEFIDATECQAGLGERFSEEVYATIKRICEHPYAWTDLDTKTGVASPTNFHTESSIGWLTTISEQWQSCICIENRMTGRADKNRIGIGLPITVSRQDFAVFELSRA